MLISKHSPNRRNLGSGRARWAVRQAAELPRGSDHSIIRGIYDEEYLAYLRDLLQSLTEHGLLAYVVCHPHVLGCRRSPLSTSVCIKTSGLGIAEV